MKDAMVKAELQNLGQLIGGVAATRKSELKILFYNRSEKSLTPQPDVMSHQQTVVTNATLDPPHSPENISETEKQGEALKSESLLQTNSTTAYNSKHEKITETDEPSETHSFSKKRTKKKKKRRKTINISATKDNEPNTIPNKDRCCSAPLKTLETSMIKMQEEIARQKNCLDLILLDQHRHHDKDKSSQHPSSEKLSMLENNIKTIRKTVEIQQTSIEYLMKTMEQDHTPSQPIVSPQDTKQFNTQFKVIFFLRLCQVRHIF